MKRLDSIPPRDLPKGWTVPSSGAHRCERIGEGAYWSAHAITGSVYFIRNQAADAMKVGHSRDPDRRLRELQTGNSARLHLVGAVAAAREFETLVHEEFADLALEGEWFSQSGEILAWVERLTGGSPLRSSRLVRGEPREGWWVWDETSQQHQFRPPA
jgi:hypothetical protein